MSGNVVTPRMRRRDFLAASPLVVLSAALADASLDAQQVAPPKPVLTDELSADELKMVSKSKMAADVPNFFGKGHNCAESGLLAALRFLNKPPELEWIAAGFGGGLQHRDLCGFLTSGVMAFGLHAGTTGTDAAAAKAACNKRVRSYWQWWTATAPLHCADIRQGRTDLRACERIGRLAAAKIEELITEARP